MSSVDLRPSFFMHLDSFGIAAAMASCIFGNLTNECCRSGAHTLTANTAKQKVSTNHWTKSTHETYIVLGTVEARKLEYERPPNLKPTKEGKPP